MQVWRKYNDLYSVSNDGQVRLDVAHLRSKAGKILKGHIVSTGYYQVQVIIAGKRCYRFIHRMVAELWVAKVDGHDAEIDQVIHHDPNGKRSDITFLVEEWCSGLYDSLVEMAVNNASNENSPEFEDYTLANQ